MAVQGLQVSKEEVIVLLVPVLLICIRMCEVYNSFYVHKWQGDAQEQEVSLYLVKSCSDIMEVYDLWLHYFQQININNNGFVMFITILNTSFLGKTGKHSHCSKTIFVRDCSRMEGESIHFFKCHFAFMWICCLYHLFMYIYIINEGQIYT